MSITLIHNWKPDLELERALKRFYASHEQDLENKMWEFGEGLSRLMADGGIRRLRLHSTRPAIYERVRMTLPGFGVSWGLARNAAVLYWTPWLKNSSAFSGPPEGVARVDTKLASTTDLRWATTPDRVSALTESDAILQDLARAVRQMRSATQIADELGK